MQQFMSVCLTGIWLVIFTCFGYRQEHCAGAPEPCYIDGAFEELR